MRLQLIVYIKISVCGLRWLFAGLSCGVRGSIPVRVRFLVDKLEQGQDFFRALQFCPVSIIPQLFHTHLHLHVAVTRRTNGRSMGTFQNAILLQKSEIIG